MGKQAGFLLNLLPACGAVCAGVIGSFLSISPLNAAAGAPDQGSAPPPEISATQEATVATVGSVRIGAAALERQLATSRAVTAAQKQAVLENLIRFELLHAAALAAGYDKKPETVDAVRRLVVGSFVQDEFEPQFAGLRVTEEEIKAYFEAHLADFTVPQAVRAAVIQIKVSPKASEEQRTALRARAEAARAEALALPPATASFGAVAVKYSDDQATRYRGGDAGWLRAGQRESLWDEEVTSAIFSLREPGEVGPVVAAASGFHLVKLMEMRASAPRALDEVREQVSYQVLSAKKAQLEREFYTGLAARIPVSIDEQALAAVPFPVRGDPPPDSPPALPAP